MAAKSPTPRKNEVRAGAPVNFFVIRLDGGSGTPVIVTGGDRMRAVDRDRGTAGVTDNGSGDHSIHLRDAYDHVDIVSHDISGTAQTITDVVWDSTNDDIDVTLSADTALTVTICAVGYLNKENDDA